MRIGVADGDHCIAGRHQGSEAIDVVGVVNLLEMADAYAGRRLDLSTFFAGIAVLEIHELTVGALQHWTQIPKLRALETAELRVAASPRQADDAVPTVA